MPVEGFVYFVQPRHGGPVKIGFSTDVKTRLADLNVGSPVRLRLIAKFPGTPKDEWRLHQELAAHHSHGEWFWPRPALHAALERELSSHGRRVREPVESRSMRYIEPIRLVNDTSYCAFCLRHPEDQTHELYQGMGIAICKGCISMVYHGSMTQAEWLAEMRTYADEQLQRKLANPPSQEAIDAFKRRNGLKRSGLRHCRACGYEIKGNVSTHWENCEEREKTG